MAQDPKAGIALGNNCYKIRLAITSKNKGKSGGARIITHVQVINEVVYLLSAYDKSDLDNISDSELLSRIKDL
ncbi:type II toxin-antitoxin system RelE/ParE family toxin [Mucilaginibacter celer]|uniref:type II toxin-antitoxin system RelE/ParE family toxin n=1 Tax=Mucilaginibacter celer TaxID=2305508 RepID=UPI001FE0ACA5|nr:type II toxin-antitoxin system RelE/ParE family toxin [Mucilaginibacter celer]